MNENETELKVQSLVDGELTGREAEELRSAPKALAEALRRARVPM